MMLKPRQAARHSRKPRALYIAAIYLLFANNTHNFALASDIRLRKPLDASCPQPQGAQGLERAAHF